MRLLLFSISLIVLLGSCSTRFVTLTTLGNLEHSMSYDYLMEEENLRSNGVGDSWRLGQRVQPDSDEVYDVEIDGQKYTIIILENAIERRNHPNFTYMIAWPMSKFTFTYVALAFKDNKLLHWGFPADFHRSDNAEINKVGIEVSQILLDKYFDGDEQ